MRHEDLIREMTLEEKCAMLSGMDMWHTRAIERLGIPSMMLTDGPCGLRKQAGEGDQMGLGASTKATCIPSAAALADSWSPETAEAMGAVVGTDAAAQDVQVLLGPGLNTKRSPLCGRSFEYYSEDPYLAGKMAAGFIRGVQSKGVSACAKHFAANSQELVRMHSDSVMDERTLRELYLTNFEIAVKEGRPRAIMTSYNRLNGTYTNEHPHLYGILRDEWGFDGMVVTDWGGSNDFTEAVRQGMDLEMPSAGDDSPCRLVQAVRNGKISEDIVDRRVDELLDIVLAERPSGVKANPEAQHEAVREAAEKCIVLLKNEENILPLRSSAKIAVIGDFAAKPRYQGAGSSMVDPVRVDGTLDLIKRCFPDSMGFAQGFERRDKANEALAREALALAKQAEAVLLYIGLPEGSETEGLDRSHMRLPDNQVGFIRELKQVNPHIIAVLSAGSAVEMPWIGECQALVYGCLGGEAAADAMLRVLSGAVTPGGKLAETFPLRYEDMPVSRYYPGPEATSEYREGLYVGYRYFVTVKKPVRFPFGYGLSYTDFAYKNLSINAQGVSFEIANTGGREGDEIAQMYISLPGAKIFRVGKELKGFVRVSLAAGETKRVSIPFDDYTFRYFNVQSNAFEVESGDYTVQIGASSEDIRLQGTWKVKGTGKQNPYASRPVDCYRTGEVTDVSEDAFHALLGRKVPRHMWDRSKPLDINDPLCRLVYAKNPVARMVGKSMRRKVVRAVKAGKPDLNTLFMYNSTFRGLAKITGGRVSMAMAEDLLLMSNGHWHKGLCRLIGHACRRPHLNTRETAKQA